MKSALIPCLIALLITSSAIGQGTVYFYDQQSSTDETPLPGIGGPIQSAIQPWGQSFTPALTSIGFIKLLLDDGNVPDGLGATVYVNLRSGSISGPIIGTTESVTMANNFAGTATFLFPTAISLTPGTVYYFQPVQQSGGTWNIVSGEYPYAGGTEWSAGFPVSGVNFWFREGTLVPEPSAVALGMLGFAALAYFRRRGYPLPFAQIREIRGCTTPRSPSGAHQQSSSPPITPTLHYSTPRQLYVFHAFSAVKSSAVKKLLRG